MDGILPLPNQPGPAGPAGPPGEKGPPGDGVIEALERYFCRSVYPGDGWVSDSAIRYIGTFGDYDGLVVVFRPDKRDYWSFRAPDFSNYVDGPVYMVLWCVVWEDARHEFFLQSSKVIAGESYTEGNRHDFLVLGDGAVGTMQAVQITLPAEFVSARVKNELLFSYELGRSGPSDDSNLEAYIWRVDFYYNGLWPAPNT